MAECIYKRLGMSFKAMLTIIANAGDSITVSGPENYAFTMNSSGIVTITVKDKGLYTVSASVSKISSSVDIQKRDQNYPIDVSFIHTVIVNANPNSTVTLTNNDGSTVSYNAKAGSNGVATITVKRKGTFTISTDATATGTVWSTSPASKTSVACSTKNGSTTINAVRVSDISSITVGLYSSSGFTVYCYWANSSTVYRSGVRVQYNKGSAPTSITSGMNMGDGAGTKRTIKKDSSMECFISGTLNSGSTYYFLGSAYVTINGVKYYGTKRTKSYYVSSNAVSNKAYSSSGSITVPDGCWSMSYFLAGGGGGGGRDGGSTLAGGGGGGGYTVKNSIAVVPGDTISWSIGAGAGEGGTGGTTRIYRNSSQLGTAAGGKGGTVVQPRRLIASGGDGGAGGGAGAWRVTPNESHYFAGSTKGGSNGASASRTSTDGGYYSLGGNGTSADAVTYNGIAYCGGGGGGGIYWEYMSGSSGGTTGGGKGGDYSVNGSNGTAGTGGGGGGAGGKASGGSGGSGVVILSLW